jgi:hypothetical protein
MFAVAFVALLGQPQAWSGVYSFGRTLSPLLIWLGMEGLRSRSWTFLLPLGLMAPRLLFQLQPQWRGILLGK